ncbi:hypothetical protein QE152_g3516 [Popillia japonica]|uniref:Uncharacterized protein n=1 Tax=Popillia japonica TaxID=7064 RepID=A0AAW1N6A2_POPJA
MDDIKDLENLILVNIPNTKTNKPRSFTILGDVYINLYREYAALRPKDINFTRFFIKFQNGKCHKVVMGIHKISSVAKDIASYLKLPNPSQYHKVVMGIHKISSVAKDIASYLKLPNPSQYTGPVVFDERQQLC